MLDCNNWPVNKQKKNLFIKFWPKKSLLEGVDAESVWFGNCMDNRKTGQETYVTWADLLSPIGWFVLQDGVGWFHHSGDL